MNYAIDDSKKILTVAYDLCMNSVTGSCYCKQKRDRRGMSEGIVVNVKRDARVFY